MSNRLSSLIKKKIVRKDQNLISLDDPFHTIEKLLKNHKITTILDAGASNGSLSRQLMQHFPDAKIYGFEPNRSYQVLLDQLHEQNKRFIPQYLALGEKTSQAVLNLAASKGNTSLFAPGERLKEYDHDGAEIIESQEVDVVSIDEWSRLKKINTIEIMKFDIQGSELNAMKGASQVLNDSTLAIFTEVLFNPLYEGGAIFSEIDQFLRTCGFVLFDFYKPKYAKNKLLLWGNATYFHAERVGI